MAENELLKKGTLYRESQDELAKRRGSGFLALISELDWLLALELEQGKPLDENKITTSQKVWVWEKGFLFGLGIHSAVLFVLTLSMALYLYALDGPPWVGELGYGLLLLFSILVLKVAIPLWFLNTYYLYPRGVVATYLSWFLWGYSFGIFLADLLYFLFILVGKLGIWLVSFSDIWESIHSFVEKYLPQFGSTWWLLADFFNIPLAFLPILLFHRWRKKHPLGRYPWLPLDHLPEEDED